MHKETISWNAHLYDDQHHFVADYGHDLVRLLAPLRGESILDAGCGTGTLAGVIAELGAEVVGVDLSANMIEKARTAYPEITFEVADLTSFDLDETFHAVFSNATLHWITNPAAALQCIHSHLVDGGRFVLEMGGQGNVANILQAIKETLDEAGYTGRAGGTGSWYFPSVGEYTTLLEQQGFEVQQVHYFGRPTRLSGLDGMAKWIEMFGLYLFEGIEDRTEVEKLIQVAVEKLRPTHFIKNEWWADYRRLRIKARKLA